MRLQQLVPVMRCGGKRSNSRHLDSIWSRGSVQDCTRLADGVMAFVRRRKAYKSRILVPLMPRPLIDRCNLGQSFSGVGRKEQVKEREQVRKSTPEYGLDGTSKCATGQGNVSTDKFALPCRSIEVIEDYLEDIVTEGRVRQVRVLTGSVEFRHHC